MRKGFLLSLIALPGLLSVSAKEQTVVVRDMTGTRIRCKRVYASDMNKNKIADAVFSPKDTTFVFSEHPAVPYKIALVIDNENQDEWVDEITEVKDTLIADLPVDYTSVSLQELEVVGDPNTITDDRTIYRPSSKQKRISTDGNSLLLTMGIPELKVNPVANTVTTLSGDNVTYFIDYLPASEEQVKNIRTADVKRVEIFKNPADPIFRGARDVINFVMVRYESGGYTKISANQYFVTPYTRGSIATRFMKDKITLDAGVNGYYCRQTHNAAVEEKSYLLDNGLLEWTDRSDVKKQNIDSESAYVRLNYNTNNFSMSHTVGIGFNNTPWYSTVFSTNYSSLFSNLSGSKRDMNNSLSPFWAGSFYFQLPKGWVLSLDPSFSYGHNKSGYEYLTVDDRILNDARENTFYARLSGEVSKMFQNNAHRVGLGVTCSDQNFKIKYSGSSNTDVNSNEFEFNFTPNVSLNFKKFGIYASVGVGALSSSINSEKQTDMLLRYYASATYNINSRNRVSLSSQLAYTVIPMSQRSPNMIVNTELEAVKGNPLLKPNVHTCQTIDYLFFPTSGLSLSAFGRFARDTRATAFYIDPIYREDGRPLLVSSTENSGFQNILTAGLSANYSLLRNTLYLGANMEYSCMRRHGIQNMASDWVTFSAFATYYLGNFYIQPYYSHSSRGYSNASVSAAPASYQVKLGWSNGPLNISAAAMNFAKSDWKSGETWMESMGYRRHDITYGGFAHRSFMVSLSYTFSYGKKITQENINAPQSTIQSGILK